jgi:protease I
MFGFGSKKSRLKGARVAILVADGVEQAELDAAVKALQNVGAETFLIGLRPGKIRALRALKSGASVPIDVTIEDVHPASFKALVIPGGTYHADRLRLNDRVREFVRSFDRNGKPIAAIGHGVWVLSSSGVVPGKKLTAWPGIKDDIVNAGAEWVDEPTVADNNLLTSRTTKDVKAWRKQMIKHFAQQLG